MLTTKNINNQFSKACEDGNLVAVQKLLRKHPEEIDVNLPSSYYSRRYTPLMSACSGNHVFIIKRLFCHPGFNINATNRENETALAYMCRMNFSFSFAIVRLLLTHPDIDVNIPDKKGRTAITYTFRPVAAGDIFRLLLPRSLILNLNITSESDLWVPTILLEYQAIVLLATSRHCKRVGLRSLFARSMSMDLIRVLKSFLLL